MDLRHKLRDLEHGFQMPAGVRESRPRHVRLTGLGVWVIALAIILLIGAGVALIGLTQASLRSSANQAALASRGITAEAIVTRIWRDGQGKWKVAYSFTGSGQTITSSRQVSAARGRALAVGAPITVRYLPERPALHDLGRPRNGLPLVMGPLVFVILSACALLCLHAIHRQRALLQDGRLAPGLVTGVISRGSAHSGKHHTVDYAFLLPSGAVATGRRVMVTAPPGVGSTLTIIYDTQRPSRSVRYPLALVTPG